MRAMAIAAVLAGAFLTAAPVAGAQPGTTCNDGSPGVFRVCIPTYPGPPETGCAWTASPDVSLVAAAQCRLGNPPQTLTEYLEMKANGEIS